MDNIYCSPKRFGFEIFDTIEDGGQYEYRITLVLKNLETGKLFYAHDCGSSYPIPFDGVEVSNLKPLALETFEEFKRDVRVYHEYSNPPPSVYLDCFDKVRAYLNQ